MSFLNLCNGIHLYDKNTLSGSGKINFHNYKNFIHRNNSTLLIESIHQYSSLLIEKFYGRQSHEAYVPVVIKYIDVYEPPYSSIINMNGLVTFENNFFRVNSEFNFLTNKNKIINGRADVFMKLLPIKKVNAKENIIYFGKDLIHIKENKINNNDYIINFNINGYNHIFEEHFPGNSICPASIIIEFILEMSSFFSNCKKYRIHNTKFISSLIPSKNYYLYLRENSYGIIFHIMDEEKNRMMTGQLK